jgi:hypothetical protein
MIISEKEKLGPIKAKIGRPYCLPILAEQVMQPHHKLCCYVNRDMG